MTILKKPLHSNANILVDEVTLGRFQVLFDINKHQVINDIGIEGEPLEQGELFSFFESLIGKSLDEAYRLGSVDIKSPYGELVSLQLKRMIEVFRGDVVAFNYQDLVCRCFGITKSDIQGKSSEVTTFDQLIEMTSACMGCRSCRQDVLEIFLDSKKETRTFLDIPNAQWVSKCDQLLKSFLETTPIDFSGIDAQIVSFKSGIVKVKCSENSKSRNSFKFSFEQFLTQELEQKITIFYC